MLTADLRRSLVNYSRGIRRGLRMEQRQIQATTACSESVPTSLPALDQTMARATRLKWTL